MTNKIFLALFFTLISTTSFASVESSLMAIKTSLLTVILPMFAVIGVAFAAFSFFTGNVQAKQHLLYAMVGCGILFGAQAIVDFVSRLVQ